MRPSPHGATPGAPAGEVRYPFGVQNDLGQVILASRQKEGVPVPSANAAVSSPASPPPGSRLHPHVDVSPSRLSLQSGSFQCSLGSSTGDLTVEAAQLERAIRNNDTIRVKRFLDLHHDKFQVNLHSSFLDKSSCESQSQDVEILLRKSKTLIDRLQPNVGGSSCDSSSSALHEPQVPLIFSNALHVAVDHGSVDVARLLLKYGLEPNQGGRLPGPPASSFFRAPTPCPNGPSSPPMVGIALDPPPLQRRTPWLSPASPSHLVPSITTSPAADPTPYRVAITSPTGGSGKRRRAATLTAPRQRSFSLESDTTDLLRPGAAGSGLGASSGETRRSVSLKSSPLMSPRPASLLPLPHVVPPPCGKTGTNAPERSIFAELRRSSEIFKSILLNLSTRDAEGQQGKKGADDQEGGGGGGVGAGGGGGSGPTSPDAVDLAGLLAAHEQRRRTTYENEDSSSTSSPTSSSPTSSSSQSSPCPSSCSLGSTSSSSCSGPDDDPLLTVNPALPADKVDGIAHHYTRHYLFTLPALFLAVVRGNATLVYLLLKYGAAVNFQDGQGNTPLHLAVSQQAVPWECVLDLVERGAQVAVRNRAGVRPVDLAPSGLLTRLQDQMLADCWAALAPATTVPQPPQGAPPAPAPATAPPATPAGAESPGSRNPTRILRKLRTASGGGAGGGGARTESTEEASSASVEMLAPSSTGSVRSRNSCRSLDAAAATAAPPAAGGSTTSKDNADALSKQDSRRRARRKAWREARQVHVSQTTEKSRSLEAERSFQVLLHMASNPECLGSVLRGLLANIPCLLRLLQHLNHSALHRSMAALLHTVLKTAVETYGGRAQTPQSAGTECAVSESGRQLSAALCLLLRVCLSLIHGVHDLQYTAMVTINKAIDVCVVHRLAHVRVRPAQALHHPCRPANISSLEPTTTIAHGGDPAPRPTTTEPSGGSRRRLGAKRLGSVWRHSSTSEPAERHHDDVSAADREESVIDVLSSVHALSVLNILHNALTLYKRVVGSKQQCSPSQRWRHCSYHCLQILAARALLFMVEGPAVQAQLAQEPQLRILAAALDSTHDPQLLVLVLQIVATLALEPAHHRALLDQGLPDVLSQLLLPSDEWYYTNHSTRYARYVKHHAARALVYLGLQHRVNLRFSVYDILQEDLPPPTPLTESVEDTYISMTSAPPPIVHCPQTNNVLGLSVEGAVMHVLKTLETSLSQGTASAADWATPHWALSGASYTHATQPRGQASSLLHGLLACLPCVLSPVVLLRLLLHRLLTTAAPHLARWRSCASRSSFASAHEGPRTPRSRASSTDTEPSSLRKRRKVNLTVDCTSVLDMEESQQQQQQQHHVSSSSSRARTLHRPSFQQVPLERACSLVPATRDSLGLEPAVQATLFAFSHLLRQAPSKDSLQSSSDGRSAPGSPSLVVLPVPAQHLKPRRSSFRFSSLHKRRSKSQANIAAVAVTAVAAAKGVVVHRRGDTPEQDILAFQKQLQNLPDFDSPEHQDPVAAAEFMASRPYLRPRSRSMPRVSYETSSRFLTLPDAWAPWPGGGGRLHRGRSAGALPPPGEHSPATTPVGDKGPPQGGDGSNSRRSSLSPSDRSGRRRDSPACILVEVPPWHRAILNFLEEWLRVSRVELDRNPPLCRELRDFLGKVSGCGPPYQQWSAEMRQEYPALTRDPDLDSGDDLEETDREYCQVRFYHHHRGMNM